MKRILLVLSILSIVFNSQAESIKVSNLNDSGAGSLREALSIAELSFMSQTRIDSVIINVVGTIFLDSTINVVPVSIIGGGVDDVKIDGSSFDGPIFRFIDPYGQGGPPLDRPLAVSTEIVKGITLQNSTSSSNGGACEIESYLYVSFDSVTFLNNKAPNGGAVYIGDGASVSIDNSSLVKNEALTGDGGAVYLPNLGMGGNLELTSTMFTNNNALLGKGGAIFSEAYLVINSSGFSTNESISGGAIYSGSYAYLNVYTSTFDANKTTSGFGGGIVLEGDYLSATIETSTFSNNISQKGGGAIYLNDRSGQGQGLELKNSTVSGNISVNNGGGIYIEAGNVNMVYNSVTENNAGDTGGGVFFVNGNLNLRMTVISNNSSTNNAPVANDIMNLSTNPVNSNNYNYIGIYEGPWQFVGEMPEDFIGTSSVPGDAMLGPLQDNGGLTFTHEPLTGSPLLDKIPNWVVGEEGGFDQRGDGFARLQGSDGDIGSVEYFCDHIVDLTTDGNECGTLREAIDYANSDTRQELISFNLPKNSTIELIDSILITSNVLLYGHVYDEKSQTVDSSRIGIRSIGVGKNGLVLQNGATGTEIVNFNFQNFGGSAIKVKETYGVLIARNSFGTELGDSTKKGDKNNIGISVLESEDIVIGESGFSSSIVPIKAVGNQFLGNETAVYSDSASNNIFVNKGAFSCNNIAIASSYPKPKIDTIFPGYIRGKASPGDVLDIYADTTCSKDQGLIYVGSVTARADSIWETFSFDFNPSFVYVATAVVDFGEGFGTTSPFSAPQTVTPCDTLLPIADIEICGDTLAEKMNLTIPFGYNVSFDVPQTEIFLNYRGDTLMSNQFPLGTQKVIASINNGFCNSEVEFDVINYDLPDQAKILTSIYTLCDDSVQLNAATPEFGMGVWNTTSAVSIVDTSMTLTTIKNINEGDTVYVSWNVSNGTCPISSDSILIERGVSKSFDVTLVQGNQPVCSSDSIHFEANLNHEYDANDYIKWFVNDVEIEGQNGGDTLFSQSNLNDRDTIKVIYDRLNQSECYVQSIDTAELVLDILQQSLIAMDDIAQITMFTSDTFNVVNNDVRINQSISGVVVMRGAATVIGDTALLYNGNVKGVDTVEYAILSSCGDVDTALLIIDVINTAPVAKDTLLNVLSGGSVFVNVNDLFSDAENNLDEFSSRIIQQSTSQGLFTVMSNMIEVNYSNDITYTGKDTIWVEAADDALEKDTVRIIFIVSDTVKADAGIDQVITTPTTVLSGNVAAGYTTYWTSNSPSVTFDDFNIANATISGLTPLDSPYELVWNISNGVKVESDTVFITVQNSAPVASDFMITIKPATDTLLNILDLFADAESNLDFTTLVIGSQSNSSASVVIVDDSLLMTYSGINSYTGVDTVEVSISDVFGEIAIAKFIIDVNENIPVSAGEDQIISTPSTALEGNVLIGYISYWSTNSTDVVFTDSTDASTAISGLKPLETPYELVWNISNGANTVSDTVYITVVNTAPIADDLSLTIKPNSDTVVFVRGLFADAENNEDDQSLKIVSISNNNAVVNLSNDSLSISYTSIPTYIGKDTILVSLTDVFGEVDVAEIIIDVTEKLKPNAGADQTIYAYSTTLGATPVNSNYTGKWSSVKSGITFDDPANAATVARGFLPKEKVYSLIWTISNGIDFESDTVFITVENVAPVVTSIDVTITEDYSVINADSLIRDDNNNLAKTVTIIKPFSYLPSSVVEIDVEALTITIDLTKDKRYSKSQGIKDSLEYQVCDEEGSCDEGYIKVIRVGESITKVIEDISNVEIGTSFNFLSPNGDGINETFFFNLQFGVEKWYFVDEDQKDGELRAGDVYETIFNDLISSVEITIINRWGDEVASYDNYFGGTNTKNGEVFPDDVVWKGKDKQGNYVTPGTYYYYIILHARKGEDAKINGFIEVRN